MLSFIQILKSRILVYSLASTFLIFFYSCEKNSDPPEKASLEITVRGTFSGKTRENIKVRIYYTEEEADNIMEPIKPLLVTDNDGKVTFSNLDANENYWIRADAILSSNVKETHYLNEGRNTFEIRLW